MAKLRPLVAHCRLLLGEAQKEPPCLARHRIPLEKWPPALAAFDSLITKVAALESLLKGEGLVRLQASPCCHCGSYQTVGPILLPLTV